jgi:hypothetical protein
MMPAVADERLELCYNLLPVVAHATDRNHAGRHRRVARVFGPGVHSQILAVDLDEVLLVVDVTMTMGREMQGRAKETTSW